MLFFSFLCIYILLQASFSAYGDNAKRHRNSTGVTDDTATPLNASITDSFSSLGTIYGADASSRSTRGLVQGWGIGSASDRTSPGPSLLSAVPGVDTSLSDISEPHVPPIGGAASVPWAAASLGGDSFNDHPDASGEHLS